jgi:hypothetical protein
MIGDNPYFKKLKKMELSDSGTLAAVLKIKFVVVLGPSGFVL